jgi:hypothetical protein
MTGRQKDDNKEESLHHIGVTTSGGQVSMEHRHSKRVVHTKAHNRTEYTAAKWESPDAEDCTGIQTSIINLYSQTDRKRIKRLKWNS